MANAFAGIPIRTRRLLLRPYHESDAEDLFGIFSDPRVMRFMGAPWTSMGHAREVIARDVAAIASGETLSLAIERREDSRLIGHCVLFRLSEGCRRAEIGYGLAEWAWGHGFMNEALRALVRYGFDQLSLNRIEADTDPRNRPSVRTLERLGFVREGLLRERWIVDGEVSDSAMYGLLHRDWHAARG